MTPIYERRFLFEPIEFRGAENGTAIVAAGVAIRYGAISKDLGGYVERVEPSAAKKTIKERDIVALTNHDPNWLLGRTSSGTLRLDNSPSELRYEIDLPDTTAGRDTAALLERRDMIGSSFGFRNVVPVKWSKTESGQALRSVVEMSIRDVGPVTFAAYDASSAELALRSLSEQTGYELRFLLDAAHQDHLADYLEPKPSDIADEERGDDGEDTDSPTDTEQRDDSRETTVVRRRRSFGAY